MRRPTGIEVGIGLVIAAAFALIVAGALALSSTIANLRETAGEQELALARLTDDYARLYAEAQASGVEPEAPAPEDVAESLPMPVPGARGADGPVGPRGETGTTGPRGPQGEPGPKGDPGPQGATGATGAAGTAGARGEAGSAGAKGDAGAAGAPGPQGEPGPQGPAGPPGDIGPVGPAGPAGRGVQSIACQEDTSWLITYTDGATSTTNGPCWAATPIIPGGP